MEGGTGYFDKIQETLFYGTLLTIVGSLFSYVCWQITGLVYYHIWQNYCVSLNIHVTDPIYQWVLLWLKRHGPLNDARHWTVETMVGNLCVVS